MAGNVRIVTRAARTSKMPDWSDEYVDLVEHTSASFEEIGRRLRFCSRRGYQVVDLAVLFLAMLCGYSKGGIAGFRKQVRGCMARLAAVAGLRGLPSQPAVARALQSADRIAELDENLAWLLSADAGVQALVRSPLVQELDAHGQRWLALDFDPTVVALRQRALPEGEDLPAPRRRAAGMSALGYSGRHRGETQMSTAVLSLASAGLFVQATTHAGNTPFAQALGVAAQAVVKLVERCELERDRCLMRFDGAGGHARAIAEVQRRGLRYLTRLQHLDLLSVPEVAEHLVRASWHKVADARSGPARQATELGRYVVGCDERGESVTSRVVVSRFASPDEQKHGAGVVIEGWQYEVFATDLGPSAWPAEDTVTLYYGRVGQENQFGRAIKQCRLGEVFCYDLVGQQLATGLMMWASNVRQARAVTVVGDLGQPPAQPARVEACPVSPHDVACDAPSDLPPPEPTPEPPAEPTTQACVPTTDDDHGDEHALAQRQPDQTPPPQLEPQAQTEAPMTDDGRGSEQQGGTSQTTMSTGPAAHRPCPQGLLARLCNIRPFHGYGCYAVYRMPAGVCASCPQRSDCTKSSNPLFRREFSVPLDRSALADRARILAEVRRIATNAPRRPAVSPAATPRPATAGKPPRWTSPQPRDAGPLLPAAPCLRPSVLVQMWHDLHRGFAIDVHIVPRPSPRVAPWIATDTAARQAQRKTWGQRNRWNAVQGAVSVIRRQLLVDEPQLTTWPNAA